MLKKIRKNRRKRLLALSITAGVLISGININHPTTANANSSQAVQSSEQGSSVLAPKLLNEASIDAVIAAMTLQEKAFLVVGGNKDGLVAENGEVIGGQSTKVPGAAGQTQAIDRLGIPAIVMADGPMGVRISPTRPNDSKTYYATKFPSPTVLASTWDTGLVNEVGVATRQELKAFGIDLLLAPGMNIQSYLLTGRNF
jgi:beta-glucosidase